MTAALSRALTVTTLVLLATMSLCRSSPTSQPQFQSLSHNNNEQQQQQQGNTQPSILSTILSISNEITSQELLSAKRDRDSGNKRETYNLLEPSVECGVSPIRDAKIVGGHSTARGQYPWAVSVRLKFNNLKHHCGGVLVGSRWVLTAAHCVASFSPQSFVVRLGTHIRNYKPEHIDLNVDMLIAHEQFTFQSFHNDIALIRLTEKVEFTKWIQPICLPNPPSNATTESLLVNKKGTVIGWGRLSQSGSSPTVLQQVELPVIDNVQCVKWYNQQARFIVLKATQFCAGFEHGGFDACQGDSGGPMMMQNTTTGRTEIVGIVSAGIGCALPKLPGLYTKVSAYLDWIQHNTQKHN